MKTQSFTISTVQYGCFIEYIPQRGAVTQDSNGLITNVVVEIDKMFLPKVRTGQIATTIVDDVEYRLAITRVYPLVNGRFRVDMNFIGKSKPNVRHDYNLRIRLELSEPTDAVVLPMGSFYRESRFQWVFVINDARLVVKRAITPGRRSMDYFEVLDGLKPGERVITSSYERFIGRDSIELDRWIVEVNE
jgi:HlyD family secretion protein